VLLAESEALTHAASHERTRVLLSARGATGVQGSSFASNGSKVGAVKVRGLLITRSRSEERNPSNARARVRARLAAREDEVGAWPMIFGGIRVGIRSSAKCDEHEEHSARVSRGSRFRDPLCGSAAETGHWTLDPDVVRLLRFLFAEDALVNTIRWKLGCTSSDSHAVPQPSGRPVR